MLPYTGPPRRAWIATEGSTTTGWAQAACVRASPHTPNNTAVRERRSFNKERMVKPHSGTVGDSMRRMYASPHGFSAPPLGAEDKRTAELVKIRNGHAWPRPACPGHVNA